MDAERKTIKYKVEGPDGELEFEQRILTAIQLERILGLMEEVDLDKLQNDFISGNMDVVSLLGKKLTDFTAIVLRESGKWPPYDDDEFEAHRRKVAVALDVETQQKVATDFLVVTPVSTLVEKWAGMIKETIAVATKPMEKSETSDE